MKKMSENTVAFFIDEQVKEPYYFLFLWVVDSAIIFSNIIFHVICILIAKHSLLLQEREFLRLKSEFDSILNQVETSKSASDVLSGLELQNTKLKHRIAILTKV